MCMQRAASDIVQGYENPEKVVATWLSCVIASQYLSDRLLMDIRSVEWHMRFWQHRLKAGNNRLFMACSHGPVVFGKAVAKTVKDLVQPSEEAPEPRVDATQAIEQRIVTLRTMLHMLTSLLTRVHAAAAHLSITPELVSSTRACARGCPAERVDGSTARAVAAVADVVSTELLRAAQALGDLQNHLDQLVDGSISVSVSSKPLLLAPDTIPAVRPEAPTPLADVTDVPLLLARADLRLLQARDFLRATSLHLGPWRGDPVGGAKHATAAADAAVGGLVRIPEFARAPSRLQRHWFAYAANALVAAVVLRWLYKNSALAGSDNLQKWITKGYSSTVRGFRDNVVLPLKNVRNEFFETFSARAAYSEFSRTDFEASKASLQRMLDDFERDIARRDPGFKGGAEGGKDGGQTGMAVLLRHYELELKRPIFNMFTGNLPRSLLIQVHKMKTDLEAAMLELDKIMRANELTVAVTAALPAMVVAGGLSYFAFRAIAPPPANLRTAAGPTRVAMAELEQAIDAAVSLEEMLSPLVALGGSSAGLARTHGGTSPTAFPLAPDPDGGSGGAAVSADEDAEGDHDLQFARGAVLVCTAKLRCMASQVYSQSSNAFAGAGSTDAWAAEWVNLERDLQGIVAADSAAQQARVAARMHRAYLVFRS